MNIKEALWGEGGIRMFGGADSIELIYPADEHFRKALEYISEEQCVAMLEKLLKNYQKEIEKSIFN